MGQAERILQLIGTFLPVYGVVLTAFLGIVLRGWWRVAALLLVPLLTYGLGDYFGSMLGFDGNMLFVTIHLSFCVGLVIYYPILLIALIFVWLRRRKTVVS